MSTRLLYLGVVLIWVLIVLAIGVRIQNYRTQTAVVVHQRPQFQTDDLQYTLNRLNQLRISWEHRRSILVGDKLMMQTICLDELTREIVAVEATLERQNDANR